jgi:hypothetical protein
MPMARITSLGLYVVCQSACSRVIQTIVHLLGLVQHRIDVHWQLHHRPISLSKSFDTVLVSLYDVSE